MITTKQKPDPQQVERFPIRCRLAVVGGVTGCLLALCLAARGAAAERVPLPSDPHWENREPGGAWCVVPLADRLWPRSWRTFTPWPFEQGDAARDDDPRAFTNVPSALVLNGVSACRASLPNYGPGILDFTVGQGAPQTGLWAMVFGLLRVDRERTVAMHVAASGPAEFWIDGNPVEGPITLDAGDHVLAGRVASGEREWMLTGCFLPVGIEARLVKGEAVPVDVPARLPWPAALKDRVPAVVGLVGDPQSGAPWGEVARALHKAAPDALVFLGDLVQDGMSAEAWNKTFFAPAETLLAEVPWMTVMGNHDRRSPLLGRFGEPNWTREVGGALIVGIDGGLDWSPGSRPRRWLEATLAAASDRLVFVASHYPAYSSRNHGKLAEDGRVLERPSRIARTHLVPLLTRYGVTALFSGHDHGYERSELPGGLTAITTAGGGARPYGVHEEGRANPHSTVRAALNHYGLLRIEGERAVFTAVGTDGALIDTRTWQRALER